LEKGGKGERKGNAGNRGPPRFANSWIHPDISIKTTENEVILFTILFLNQIPSKFKQIGQVEFLKSEWQVCNRQTVWGYLAYVTFFLSHVTNVL